MEEKDSGVVEVRFLCSSGETKDGKDEMILGATLELMIQCDQNLKPIARWRYNKEYALVLQRFYLCRTFR